MRQSSDEGDADGDGASAHSSTPSRRQPSPGPATSEVPGISTRASFEALAASGAASSSRHFDAAGVDSEVDRESEARRDGGNDSAAAGQGRAAASLSQAASGHKRRQPYERGAQGKFISSAGRPVAGAASIMAALASGSVHGLFSDTDGATGSNVSGAGSGSGSASRAGSGSGASDGASSAKRPRLVEALLLPEESLQGLGGAEGEDDFDLADDMDLDSSALGGGSLESLTSVSGLGSGETGAGSGVHTRFSMPPPSSTGNTAGSSGGGAAGAGAGLGLLGFAAAFPSPPLGPQQPAGSDGSTADAESKDAGPATGASSSEVKPPAAASQESTGGKLRALLSAAEAQNTEKSAPSAALADAEAQDSEKSALSAADAQSQVSAVCYSSDMAVVAHGREDEAETADEADVHTHKRSHHGADVPSPLKLRAMLRHGAQEQGALELAGRAKGVGAPIATGSALPRLLPATALPLSADRPVQQAMGQESPGGHGEAGAGAPSTSVGFAGNKLPLG